LKNDQTIILKLFSPEISFSDIVAKKLGNTVNIARFIGKPKDNCHPGFHHVILSVIDEKENIEIHSITFIVQITDFVFDHISRPFLSQIMSSILGIGSLAMFILTLLGQIDTTFGLASGTTTGILASVVYLRFFSLYQQSNTSNY